MALSKRQSNRGRTTTRRKETNDQIMEAATKRYGYLSVRINFAVKDELGAYRGMKGESIVVRKAGDARVVKNLMAVVHTRVIEFVKSGGI